jgi:predicted PurR-regulated permease PerM
MQPSPAKKSRHTGISLAPVLFLLAFLVAMGVIALFFFEPLLRIANEAGLEQRRRIAAYAALAICVLILALLVGLVLTLRVGRRLTSLAPKQHKPTAYPDAWEESARRMQVPSPDELEGPGEADIEKPKE